MADQKETTDIETLKPHKCPMCDYRAKTPSLLSRHINHHHPEMTDRTPSHLLGILNTKNSVPEMLASVAKWMEGATTFDEKLPEDVISYLQREDAKTQLILRVIAIGKIQRALELGDRIREMDERLKTELNDSKFKEKAGPGTYLGLIERMQELQEKELNFLKQIVQLGEVNLMDVIDKLVDAFGTARLGSKKVGATAFQLTGVTLPDDPAEREQLRGILRHIGVGDVVEDEPGRANRVLEADVEESS